MSSKKLSVMITTYNLVNYVAETLESVLDQKVDFDYEILVGDDGSSDGTIDVVKEYVDRYPDKISLYVMDRDQNKKYDRIDRASRNRVNLINHACGDYLLFLDGDDKYTDEKKLQKQIDALELPENADCIACGHNIDIYWSDDKRKPINKCNKKRKISSHEYWRYGMYFHSDTIMFRNIYKEGFPKELPAGAYDDNVIMYCLLSHGNLLYLPDNMAIYRQLENSSWNSVDEAEKCIINLLGWAVENSISKDFSEDGVYRHLYEILFMWRNHGNVSEELLNKYQSKFDEYRPSIAYSWATFGKQSKGKQIRMTIWMMGKLFRFCFMKIKKMLPGYRMN